MPFPSRDPLGTCFVDVAVMFLAMPIVLFPALAETIFARPHPLGLLYTSETVGAWSPRPCPAGIAGSTPMGESSSSPPAVMECSSPSPGRPRALALLPGTGLAGAADMTSAVFPDDPVEPVDPREPARSVVGIEMLSLLGRAWCPRSGRATPPTRGASVEPFPSGVASVVGVVIAAAALRDFWRYDARTDEHLLAERARQGPRREPRLGGMSTHRPRGDHADGPGCPSRRMPRRRRGGNPSSLHTRATSPCLVEEARERIGSALDARPRRSSSPAAARKRTTLAVKGDLPGESRQTPCAAW